MSFGKKKDLGVKIGTPEEALWTEMRDARVRTLAQLEKELIVEKAFLELCEQKIKQAHDKQ